MKIGLVAGEASGDILGAGLIKALKTHFPKAEFSGVGGPRMIAEGFDSLYDQDRLAVMGIIEPLKRLPELLSMRKSLFRYFCQQGFDCVIGIDSPEFNLPLERKLKGEGIKTVHYVSPSVWAWRQGRIKKIALSIDLMLTLLPFENKIYQDNNIPVQFVGHPLADKFELEPDLSEARRTLKAIFSGYNSDRPLLACLPGSRQSEVALLGPVFWPVVGQLQKKSPRLQCLVPAINARRRQQIEEQLMKFPQIDVHIVDGASHEVMAAADAVLLASGTTALEAMFLKKPMLVAYKLKWLSYQILSRLVKVPFVSLPNLLAGRELVPELLQDEANVENITAAISTQLNDQKNRESLQQEFNRLHQSLRADADATAAGAIAQLLARQPSNA